MTKFLFLANAARYITLSDIPNVSLLMDWALLCTILSAISYYIFIQSVLLLMSPETVVRQILKDFDQVWMDIIRNNWRQKQRHEGFIYFDNDPLVLFERYLTTTVERGDIYSVKTALIALHHKIENIMNHDDGVVIDNYLFDRLENVIDVLAQNHSDANLAVFCSAIKDITIPSEKAIGDTNFYTLDIPLGTRMLRSIAKKSIEFKLEESARRAIVFLDDRCKDLILALPVYSELWFISQPNRRQLTREETQVQYKNESKLNSLLDGYFAFFSELAQRAMEKELRWVAWAASNALLSKIDFLLEHIKEKPYQRYIISECLRNFEKIVQNACEAKFQGAISFVSIFWGLKNLEDEDTRMLIADFLSRMIVLMAKAGILDIDTVSDVVMITGELMRVVPQAAIPILNSFQIVGESSDYLIQGHTKYIQQELLHKIEHIEKVALAQPKKGFKGKISAAARNAKKQIKQLIELA